MKVWAICGALMFACAAINGDLMRDLQHEIDAINILLADNDFTPAERAYLAGKSNGLFLAIEMIHAEGIW